jgi:hypothetical protein
LLLLPATRRKFKIWLRQKFDQWIQSSNVHISRYH